MAEEIINEVKRIGEGKAGKYIFTLAYVYFIIILVSLLPSFLLELIYFIIETFCKLLSANLLLKITAFVTNIINVVITFLAFILTSPIFFGGINFFYNEAKENNKEESLHKYLGKHKLCIRQMGMMTILTINTFLFSLMLIVPGIIYISKRIMAPLILIDNENMTIKEAINESKKIMRMRCEEFYRLLIRIFLAPIGTYILANYIMQFNKLTEVVGSIILIISIVLSLLAIVKLFLAVPCMYLKIKGKKSGAVDVKFKEVK